MPPEPFKPIPNAPKQAAGLKYLDSILPQRTGEREVAGGFKMIEHSRIVVREQVRRTFPQADMDELRASIRELRAQQGGIEGTGLLQALLVSPVRDEAGAASYRLIAGERRFRATRDEGLAEVPCIVIPTATESVVRLMQLSENALRTAPPVLEEARAIRDTMDEMKLSLRDMARMLGKSLGYVTERVSLLKMGEDVQQMVFARANTLRHARLIDPIQDATLRAELIAAAVEGAGEREIRRRAEERVGQSDLSNDSPAEDNSSLASVEDSTEDEETQASQVFARANTSHAESSHALAHGISVRRTQAPRAQVQRPEAEHLNAERPDPVGQCVEPAAALLAEALRQMEGESVTVDDRRRLRQALAQAKEHIARLEEVR